ncbi:MAG: HAD-IA family hydrolase [Polyangiaceae bacterium]|nr:HAD-IA family hydrolase [Polyangiaceae bacterium]
MGPPPVLRHVIWDLGGTLIDTYPATVEVFLGMLEDWGVQAEPAEIRALFRTSTDHALRVTAARYGLDFEVVRSRHQAAAARIPEARMLPFPGAREALAVVQARGGLNLLVTHRSRVGALALLRRHGLADRFHDLVAREDPWPRKPDPASLNAIVARHALRKADCLAVGDRALDVEAGRRAGIRTCLVGQGGPGVDADLQVTSLIELAALLQQPSPIPGS